MNEQPTVEQHVEVLETKLKDYKIRIFDMAEQADELNKAFQAQQKQTQEFVTAVMTVLEMEMTEQVMLGDIIDVLKNKLTPETADEKVSTEK